MLDQEYIDALVNQALSEDIGSGDITAELVGVEEILQARVVTRESGVLCGRAFADTVFAAVDASLAVTWHCADGEELAPDDLLFEVSGNARSILTAERTALNFLQLLSGTATYSRSLAALVADLPVRLLDTRKTIPGLRLAQKYAVTCGGCYNHRIGLFDAFLIKENHIAACGGIESAISTAKTKAPGKPVEVEVESLHEFQLAIDAGADRVMLDNFSLDAMREAVALAAGRLELEASGNVNEETLRAVAETGVDFISIGALTKAVTPLDLSMRFID
ncbi:MAG: nicotinate-nucleotide diphosphorylase (carboxylating) [Halieaceae bacterium MED-G27]|nr:nicotinate-nucleotide diphosphorylase (carboxylating) [Halieaceae bacterium]OUT65765.1 MAG: nicotinate-nucleotide diphosphorylase (carboxylating) [Cellvibrionales bacterium TMED21]PDH38755.1 MAG: nicotinate-nucleotide diphosphorylase (carboxylating) [Halieaceae bacterium MED-G27]